MEKLLPSMIHNKLKGKSYEAMAIYPLIKIYLFVLAIPIVKKKSPQCIIWIKIVE